MVRLISLLSGIIFGLGLTISGMINPQKVLGFLNLFGEWDPSLIFVMFGAIIIFAPMHFIFKRKSRPIFAKEFQIIKNKNIDRNLLLGSGLFGAGWGLAGLCPGPAISSISFLNPNSLIFVLFMFVGFFIANRVEKNI